MLKKFLKWQSIAIEVLCCVICLIILKTEFAVKAINHSVDAINFLIRGLEIPRIEKILPKQK